MQSFLFYHLQLAAWNNVHIYILFNIYHSTHYENTFTLARAIQNRQNHTGLINLYFACHTYRICFVYVCNADVLIKWFDVEIKYKKMLYYFILLTISAESQMSITLENVNGYIYYFRNTIWSLMYYRSVIL